MAADIEKIIDQISRGTTEIIGVDSLKEKIKKATKEKPLRLKAGFDPTAPDIHLGHVVLLRKIRQFQDLLDDKVVVDFVVGDFTALVGDPTGRNELRPNIDAIFIADNAKTYTEQAFKILDETKTKIVYNSEWLTTFPNPKLGASNKFTGVNGMLALTANSTVAQMLARADFKKRYEDGSEISIMEFIYPLLQGYDSVELGTDVELGGNDQKFNLLMGRQLQQIYKKQSDWEERLPEYPQVVIMTPLLEGLDGVKKMSKSLNNYIGINEAPVEIFGKIMSISDDLMMRYYEILTEEDLEKVKKMHPKEAKMALGEQIVRQFYSVKIGAEARQEFERVFSQRGTPEDLEEYTPKSGETVLDVAVNMKFISSRNEGRRLVKQGAFTLDGERIDNETEPAKPGVLKVGKRRFVKVV